MTKHQRVSGADCGASMPASSTSYIFYYITWHCFISDHVSYTQAFQISVKLGHSIKLGWAMRSPDLNPELPHRGYSARTPFTRWELQFVNILLKIKDKKVYRVSNITTFIQILSVLWIRVKLWSALNLRLTGGWGGCIQPHPYGAIANVFLVTNPSLPLVSAEARKLSKAKIKSSLASTVFIKLKQQEALRTKYHQSATEVRWMTKNCWRSVMWISDNSTVNILPNARLANAN